jgi:hydroxymethylbilane synthase
MHAALRIGTRASPLARVQTDIVRDALARHHPDLAVETVLIATPGDERPDVPIPATGETGFFTSSIQQALLDGEIDLAVHSLKDLPIAEPDGLVVAAVPERADPRDVLVSRAGPLAELPGGARVGTSSVRRAEQIRAVKPDLETAPIRGNVATRVARLDAGEFDAIVLAAAGLIRLGLEDRVTEWLAAPGFLPAPGQGALAIETRENDSRARAAVAALDDPDLHAAVAAERGFLAASGGGCNAPFGALAEVRDGVLHLRAGRYGDPTVTAAFSGPPDDPAALGRRAARHLLNGHA